MPSDPSLWSGTPYRSPTAFLDLMGSVELWFHDLAVSARNAGFDSFALYPIGTPGDNEWLMSLQKMMDGAYEAMNLGRAPNVSDYSLDDESDFASFTFILSQAVEPLRLTSGMA